MLKKYANLKEEPKSNNIFTYLEYCMFVLPLFWRSHLVLTKSAQNQGTNCKIT